MVQPWLNLPKEIHTWLYSASLQHRVTLLVWLYFIWIFFQTVFLLDISKASRDKLTCNIALMHALSTLTEHLFDPVEKYRQVGLISLNQGYSSKPFEWNRIILNGSIEDDQVASRFNNSSQATLHSTCILNAITGEMTQHPPGHPSPVQLLFFSHKLNKKGMYASLLKGQGHHGIFSSVKGTLWGNFKFLLELFKGTRAMTRGHGGNHLRCLREVLGL